MQPKRRSQGYEIDGDVRVDGDHNRVRCVDGIDDVLTENEMRLTKYPVHEHVCIAVRFPDGFTARGQDASGWRCARCGNRMEEPTKTANRTIDAKSVIKTDA